MRNLPWRIAIAMRRRFLHPRHPSDGGIPDKFP
jgi:hypothetical protein